MSRLLLTLPIGTIIAILCLGRGRPRAAILAVSIPLAVIAAGLVACLVFGLGCGETP